MNDLLNNEKFWKFLKEEWLIVLVLLIGLGYVIVSALEVIIVIGLCVWLLADVWKGWWSRDDQ